jgi:hypothetical protein
MAPLGITTPTFHPLRKDLRQHDNDRRCCAINTIHFNTLQVQCISSVYQGRKVRSKAAIPKDVTVSWQGTEHLTFPKKSLVLGTTVFHSPSPVRGKKISNG